MIVIKLLFNKITKNEYLNIKYLINLINRAYFIKTHFKLIIQNTINFIIVRELKFNKH